MTSKTQLTKIPHNTQGITRTYGFQKNGLPLIDGTGGYLWRVEDGAFVYGGPAPLTA
ncbi:hypothetical protein [Streptomyces europaeiscabiei]|uniref:hypothetical protein n=1 Tax=Streptomyces europaeiscabiei TaxID=146819 RepID=UPI0029BE5446|nr:hypothetical protein [Streptomyces europaeiscabiei]MDX2527331.1 hypothetical protein [Streptomyces europaeiscabiei]MDX3783762.1 hypothetical protein [Streptomyces europaeiscabiei]